MSDQTDRRLAESVAYFLYWSGYLEVEARENALDEAHPNWREWSCCYSPGLPATTNR
jgi:hypothetical protein